MNYGNYAFGYYLEHSCRYYLFDRPLITDAQFDALCLALIDQWDEVTHRYKHLADLDTLRAGTGYHLKYPQRIIDMVGRYPNRTLHEVFETMPLADKYEEQAYGCICLLKYGSYGGKADAKDIKRIGDFLRGGPLKPTITIPKITVTPLAPASTLVVVQPHPTPKPVAALVLPPIIKVPKP